MGAREGCGIGHKVTPEADHEAKSGFSAREHTLVLDIGWRCLKSPPLVAQGVAFLTRTRVIILMVSDSGSIYSRVGLDRVET